VLATVYMPMMRVDFKRTLGHFSRRVGGPYAACKGLCGKGDHVDAKGHRGAGVRCPLATCGTGCAGCANTKSFLES